MYTHLEHWKWHLQVRYCGKLPFFWKALYGALLGSILFIAALVSPPYTLPSFCNDINCILTLVRGRRKNRDGSAFMPLAPSFLAGPCDLARKGCRERLRRMRLQNLSGYGDVTAWGKRTPPKRGVTGMNVTVAVVLDIPRAAVRTPLHRACAQLMSYIVLVFSIVKKVSCRILRTGDGFEAVRAVEEAYRDTESVTTLAVL